MGATFNAMTMPSDKTQAQVTADFEKIQEQDRYENGHSYSGGFGMANGIKFPTAPKFERDSDATEWLSEHCQKWEEAKAVRFGPEGTWMIGAWCSS